MSPCPSGTIQEQMACIASGVYDLQYSASGVLAYSGSQTMVDYEEVWARTMRDFEERLTDLDEGIVEASGQLRIINNGLLFHRH